MHVVLTRFDLFRLLFSSHTHKIQEIKMGAGGTLRPTTYLILMLFLHGSTTLSKRHQSRNLSLASSKRSI